MTVDRLEDPALKAWPRLHLRDTPLILMYHYVGICDYDPNHLCVSPGRFDQQMALIEASGRRGVSVSELVDAMKVGRQQRLVGITFDDGYEALFEHALPTLKRRGFGATVFVIAGRLGRSNDWDDDGPRWPLVSEAQVRDLVAAGVEVGSHGVTHVPLAGAPSSELATEVDASRRILESGSGAPVRGFAYPYGSMDMAARQAVRAAGYDYACAVDANAREIDLTALPRVYIGDRDGRLRMMAKRVLNRPRMVTRTLMGDGHS